MTIFGGLWEFVIIYNSYVQASLPPPILTVFIKVKLDIFDISDIFWVSWIAPNRCCSISSEWGSGLLEMQTKAKCMVNKIGIGLQATHPQLPFVRFET